MSLNTRKIIKEKKAPLKADVKNQAMELAQLAFDVFMDKRHVVGVQKGLNNANQSKKT